MRLALTIGLLMFMAASAGATETLKTKKVVFLAGTKSHAPGDHEYEKGLRVLAHCIETSPNLKGFQTEVHLYGWPEDPKTLEDADSIVLYSDGSDHNEASHPFFVGDRLETIGRQMKRGCGLVLIHYSTFASVKRGGPEFLEWTGSHFDYETGNTPNKWASAIQTCQARPEPASPDHPVSRGLVPFDFKDEYYYRMRFRPNDDRLAPILNVAIPGETTSQTVAWAVQRDDGGRGFGTTCGHFFSNFSDENFRRTLLNGIVWSARAEVPTGGVQSAIPQGMNDIKALILTGCNHPAHDWRATTKVIGESLARDSRMKVTIWEDPEQLASPDLFQYDVLIQNYQNWERPTLGAAARANLLKFVNEGGGLVLVHFANGAWRDWPDYSGGLSRRVWIDDKSGHDPFGPMTVRVAKPDHLLTTGISDFKTTDELYYNQVGDKPIDPILTARSQITGRDEPLAYTYEIGRGRVFQTLLGHAPESVATPAASEILRRASAWAAKREVLPLPVEKDPHTSAAKGVIRLEPGRFGNALDCRNTTARAQQTAHFEAPMTVECWAKLRSARDYNILIANHLKESSQHWEIFSDIRTGNLCAYLPGFSPPRVDSDVNITDDSWHHIGFQFHQNRAILFVDGKRVTDKALTPPHNPEKGVGGILWFGCYPPGNLSCDGFLDDVRISNYPRPIEAVPTSPMILDRDTLGLWRFDNVEDGKVPDASSRANPVTVGGSANTSVRPEGIGLTKPASPLPTVDPKTSVDWPNVGNDKGAMRYSTLNQINRDNVKELKVAWTYHCGDHDPSGNTTIECTPLVIEGILYLTTVRMNIVALEAATGREVWRFDPKAGGVNRGLAYWSDNQPGGRRRILVSLMNGFLYSLDAKTGELDPAFGEQGLVDLRKEMDEDMTRFAYGSSSAPAVFENLVILGFISSEVGPGAPGDIRAFDVRTGKQAWRFHTIPRPGEFAHETWPADAWKERGGANAWPGLTVDEKNGIVFAGTGSAASDFYGADRPGDNLFANCTLALDARTGKRIWHYQTVHHDVWDRDTPCPPTVCEFKHNGEMVEAVAQPTKTGYVFLFDRKTGKPLYEVKEEPVPVSDVPGEKSSPTQPFPVRPPAISKQGFTEADVTTVSKEAHDHILEKLRTYKHGSGYHAPSLQGSVILPGFHGGANWSGASFDPTTGKLYVTSCNVPWVATLQRDDTMGYTLTGYNYFRDQSGYPANKPPWGLLTAIDLARGEFAWQVVHGRVPELESKGIPQTGTENFGGTIVTTGGLLFVGGTRDEMFHAYDSKTGKLLLEHKLPAGGFATPCTYMVNGKQYVVIACGGGGKLVTTPGDAYVAFALPD